MQLSISQILDTTFSGLLSLNGALTDSAKLKESSNASESTEHSGDSIPFPSEIIKSIETSLTEQVKPVTKPA